MILDVDHYVMCASIRIQRHFGVMLRKLERVLQQISYRREKHILVYIYRKSRFYGGDAKAASPFARLKGRERFDLGDELRKTHNLVPCRQAGC
jgi:hypothetical protein